MEKNQVFLTDLHIGTNHETNWYQKEFHQPILKSILSYLVKNGNQIEDVVILGDWFEQWNYPPHKKVPNLDAIFSMNPEIFTKSKDGGDFVTLMESINGNLRFINGDHDMLVELKDINKHFSKYTEKRVLPGHGKDLEKPAISNTYYLNGAVWGEHGHQYDLFHRPTSSMDNDCSPLPLGYFISRLYCHFLEKKISSMHRLNASCIADVSNSELSNLGVKFSTFVEKLIAQIQQNRPIDAAKIIIDQLMQFNRNFHMDFNLSHEGFGEVDSMKVPDLYNEIITLENFGEAIVSAEVAYSGLSKFAKKHFLKNPNCRVAVMGHTHKAELEICGSGKSHVYANAGFTCPSMPDVKSSNHRASFIIVNERESTGIDVTLKVVTDSPNLEIISAHELFVEG
jgi:UDP-2,3-diacylglucosamine pyrophosphatase LpxH